MLTIVRHLGTHPWGTRMIHWNTRLYYRTNRSANMCECSLDMKMNNVSAVTYSHRYLGVGKNLIPHITIITFKLGLKSWTSKTNKASNIRYSLVKNEREPIQVTYLQSCPSLFLTLCQGYVERLGPHHLAVHFTHLKFSVNHSVQGKHQNPNKN
jgi:hypothetical protein